MPLRTFVFREFFKTALIPLLFIELALVLLYFGINAYNQRNMVNTLEQEITSHLEVVVSNKTKLLSEQLQTITILADLLQHQVQLYYLNQTAEAPYSALPVEFDYAPNGVFYKTRDNGGSSLFYSTVTHIGPEEAAKARSSELLDPLFKDICNASPNIVAVYLNTFDSMNRYYPYIAKVYEQFLPDMVIPEFNFYYLADQVHNPGRGVVWTETYLDPAGKGWMMSSIVPIYKGDFLEGVVGIDVTITKFIDHMLNLQLPWGGEAFLVDNRGTIMAMPKGVETLLGLTELGEYTYHERVAADTYKPEAFNLLKTTIPGLADRIRKLMQRENAVLDIEIDSQSYLISQATEPLTGWKLMLLVDKKQFLAPTFRMEKNGRQIGYFAVAGMVIFYALFFVYLVVNAKKISGRIARPVTDISLRSARISVGEYGAQASESGIEELDALHDSFNLMVKEIKLLHTNLMEEIHKANLELEERKQAQDALKKSEEKLYGIFNHTFQFIGLLDREGRLSDVNRTALDFVGVSAEDVVGKPFWETPWWHHSPESQQLLRNAIARCKSGELVRFETSHVSHNGTVEQVDFSLTPVKDESGDIAMMVPEARIITELKKVQQELIIARDAAESANKAKSEFIGNMSHELRTPLNHIIGFTSVVLDKNLGALSERQEQYLRNVLEGGRKLLSLINDVLDIAQIEAGQQEVTLTSFNLRIVLENSLAMVHEKIVKKGIQFSYDITAAPEIFFADERKIKQILYNLLANAVKFTPENGTISLLVQKRAAAPADGEKDYIEISVVDSGVGLLPADMERIFGKFGWVDGSTTRNFQGAGIGLPLTRYLVEMHEGKIWATSDGVNKGATFTVRLPVRRV